MFKPEKSESPSKEDIHLKDAIDEYGEYLLRLAYTYVKDWPSAEDIVQEVYISYYKNLSKFEYKASLKTYLYRITVNKCHDSLRRQKNKVFPGLFTSLLISKYTPESVTIKNEDSNELIKEVLALPVKYREVVLLFYYQELTLLEISIVLRCSQNTIKTRLYRAKNLLKSNLSQDWEGFNFEQN